MALILNGRPVDMPDGDKVVDRIMFTPGINRNTRAHVGDWLGLGIHWTGGERGYQGVSSVLTARELSIHFILEPDGRLVQTADLATRCAHIGKPGNQRFIGLETACRGYATKADLAEAQLADPTLRARDDLDWTSPRDTYRDIIAGKGVHFAGFNPEQLRSLVWLAETLAVVLKFPRLIPARRIVGSVDSFLKRPSPLVDPAKLLVEHDGGLWWPDFERHGAKWAAQYSGALGHFHVHKTKHDPGTQPFYALWAEGWNPAQKKLPGALPL